MMPSYFCLCVTHLRRSLSHFTHNALNEMAILFWGCVVGALFYRVGHNETMEPWPLLISECCNLRKIRVENICVKIFSWVWQTMKITHAKNFEHLNLNLNNRSNVCLVMYTRRESEINQSSLIHPVDKLLQVLLLHMENIASLGYRTQ